MVLNYVANWWEIAMLTAILQALTHHAQANIELHVTNISIYLTNPAGIGEHSDILEAIQSEMDKIAVHKDRLEILELLEPVESKEELKE